MNSSLTKLLALVLTSAACGTASASYMNPMEYNDGRNTWLQLSETTNLSVEDIITGEGNWISKYRFARQSEIEFLLNTFNLVETEYTLNSTVEAWNFISQMGGMTPSGPSGTWFSDGNQGAYGRGLNMSLGVLLTNGDNGSAINDQCPMYSSCASVEISYGPQSWTSKSPYVGFFMVRSTDVPEPSSIALFGIALAAAASSRRNAK